MSPAQVLTRLNQLGGKHGIGRLDIVENRYVGMKSRGCYETPGGTIMLKAHRAIESITLDREVAHLKDELMPKYAKLIYTGYWWAPERRMLQAMIDESQKTVNGWVRLKLYKATSSSWAASRRPTACSIRPSPPSTKMAAPTTTPMRPVSSASMPCACGLPPTPASVAAKTVPSGSLARHPRPFRAGFFASARPASAPCLVVHSGHMRRRNFCAQATRAACRHWPWPLSGAVASESLRVSCPGVECHNKPGRSCTSAPYCGCRSGCCCMAALPSRSCDLTEASPTNCRVWGGRAMPVWHDGRQCRVFCAHSCEPARAVHGLSGPGKTGYPARRFVARQSCLHADGVWTTGTLSGGFDALPEMLAQDRDDRFSQLCATHFLVSAPERLNPVLPGCHNHCDDPAAGTGGCPQPVPG